MLKAKTCRSISSTYYPSLASINDVFKLYADFLSTEAKATRFKGWDRSFPLGASFSLLKRGGLMFQFFRKDDESRFLPPDETRSLRSRLDTIARKQEILRTANRTAKNHSRFLDYAALSVSCGLSESEIADFFSRDVEDVRAWSQGWATVPFEVSRELICLSERKAAEILSFRMLRPSQLMIVAIPQKESDRCFPLGLYLSTAGEIITLNLAETTRVIYLDLDNPAKLPPEVSGDYIVKILYS